MDQEEDMPIEKKYNEKTIKWMDGQIQRSRKVIEVPIDWEGKKEIVEIKKMSYGERAEYGERIINIQIIGEIQKTDVLIKEMYMQTLIMGLNKAPFPLDRGYIDKELDFEIGEFLQFIVEDYNKLEAAFQKKSKGRSGTKSTTSESTNI